MSNMFSHILPPSPIYDEVYNCIDKMGAATRSFEHELSHLDLIYSQLYREGFLDIWVPGLRVSRYSVEQAIYHASYDLFAHEFLDMVCTLNTPYAAFVSSLLNLYRIDEVNYFVNSTQQNVGSDFWHRDGVGHRLKLFIPVDVNGRPPTTDIFPGSHVESCKPFKWEMLRVGINNPSKYKHQDLIENYYSSVYQRFYSFNWNPEKLLLLDTNTVHRAANFHSGLPGSSRAFLIVELMDPSASKIADRFRLGECGKRQNMELISLFKMKLNSFK